MLTCCLLFVTRMTIRTCWFGNFPEAMKQNSGLNRDVWVHVYCQKNYSRIPMTSLLKAAALFSVVSVGLVGLSSTPARAIDVTQGPVTTPVVAPVEVPEPSAIAPLALVGAALILRRRSVHSDAA